MDRVSCGEILLDLAGEVPRAARSCFESTIGLVAGELVIAEASVDGDPMVRFYFTSPGLDGYDLAVDQSRDRYNGGGPEWVQQRCTPATTLDDPGARCLER